MSDAHPRGSAWADAMWARPMTMRERRRIIHEKVIVASWVFKALRLAAKPNEPALEVAALVA